MPKKNTPRSREEILADKNYIHKQIEELSKKRLQILKKLQ